nr:MAG TPA: helix-turn-helix domain protein [Caudoviricetes sp.]
MYSPSEIGKRITLRREELGASMEEIAQKVGVHKSTIQRYEAGSIQRIKLPVVESIASALSVSPEWLIGLSEEKTAAPKDDGLSPLDARLNELLAQASDETKRAVLVLLERPQKP